MTAEEALGIKKTATEETLQRIASSLERIETIIMQKQNFSIDIDLNCPECKDGSDTTSLQKIKEFCGDALRQQHQ